MSIENTEDFTIPSNPADLKKIQDVVNELVNSKIRQQGETDYQKEAIKALAEDMDIPAKAIRKLMMDKYKDTFEQESEQRETYEVLYEKVFNLNQQEDTTEDE